MVFAEWNENKLRKLKMYTRTCSRMQIKPTNKMLTL